MKKLLLLALSMLLWSCASTTQKLDLNPVLVVSGSEAGERLVVQLRVTDTRPSGSFAQRGSRAVVNNAVTTHQAVADVVRDRVSEGLGRKGFQAVGENQAAARIMTISVERFDFQRPEAGMGSIVRIQAAFDVRVDARAGWFEKCFQARREEKTVLLADARDNEAVVNEVLSDLINRVLDDERLLAALLR